LVGDLDVVPVPLLHGRQPILGFRLGVCLPHRLQRHSGCVVAAARRSQVLILDALRHRPHPTHFSVSEALAVVSRLRPRATYFTHICHDLPHAATCAALPEGVELAYDGLILEI
jgi:phosphoribosyl 1,2-cyclic phosphate phosphodiesterase